MRVNGNALHLRALSITKRIGFEMCYEMCFLPFCVRFFVAYRTAVGACLELFRLNTDDSRN